MCLSLASVLDIFEYYLQKNIGTSISTLLVDLTYWHNTHSQGTHTHTTYTTIELFTSIAIDISFAELTRPWIFSTNTSIKWLPWALIIFFQMKLVHIFEKGGHEKIRKTFWRAVYNSTEYISLRKSWLWYTNKRGFAQTWKHVHTQYEAYKYTKREE